MVVRNTPASSGPGPLQPPLTVTLSRFGEQLLVHVGGEIDLLTADSLNSHLLDAAAHSSGMGVDLTGTTFIDSSGVTALVHAAHRAADTGASFFLLCPPANTAVRRTLELLQLHTVMTILDARPAEWLVVLDGLNLVDLVDRAADPRRPTRR